MTIMHHRNRHILLHRHLDEVLADFMNTTHKLPSDTTVTELVEWSHKETINPTPPHGLWKGGK